MKILNIAHILKPAGVLKEQWLRKHFFLKLNTAEYILK